MTSESECLDALRDAAERLGKSPTKAEYEELDVTPASTTVRRTLGGWNAAKEAAGLQTFDQGENGGTDVQPKPDWVEIPDDEEWEDLTGQQRWYYKNRDRRVETKENRRRRLHRWLYEFKRDELECVRCSEDRPPALDFHHDEEKRKGISEMVNDGHSKERVREEMARCDVLCANCHRKEHHTATEVDRPGRSEIETLIDQVTEHEARRLRRQWITSYKRDSNGCERCGVSSPVCLDFHHERNKTMRVGMMVSSGYTLAEIREEIEKCILLCANCHREKHFTPPASPD